MPLPKVHGEFTVGADPELKFTQSGKAVCSFSAIASKPKKNDNDEWVDDKEIWVRLTFWDQQAENVAESITKGMRIIVDGAIHVRKYEDKEGNERQSIEIDYAEIGPSIKFATAKVTKAERSNTAAAPAAADPWQSSSDAVPF